jgi:hypothetical protein
MVEVEKLKKLTDILNSEGTILGLYQIDNELFLGSFLTDKTGMVYYSTNKKALNRYLNNEITLGQVYLESEDFIVSRNFRNDTVTYLKQDLAEKIQCSDKYYNELSNELKNPNIQDQMKGS